MDLTELPEAGTYEEAQAKLDELVDEGDKITSRLAQLQQEVIYYQGVAKALEPKAE